MSALPKLPDGWRWERLANLGSLKRGQSKHRPRNAEHLYGGPYPFVQTGDIRKADGLLTEYSQTYSEAGLKQSKLWPKGTLCITIAANIAETAILGFEGCFPDSVVGFIPNEPFDVRYFDYFIRTAREDLERYAPATAQKNINLQILSEVAVPVAPLPEQRRIVARIEELFSRLDAGVAALRHAKAQLQCYRQSVLAAAVTGQLTQAWREQNPDPEPASELLHRMRVKRKNLWLRLEMEKLEAKARMPKNDKWKARYPEPQAPVGDRNADTPASWEWVSWDCVGLSQNGRAFPSGQYSDEGTKLLRPGNLHVSGEVRWTEKNTRRMPSKWEEEHPTYIVGGGELVMNLTAQSLADEFLGRVCMTSPGDHCLLNQRIARLHTVGIDPKFALCLLKAQPFRRFVDGLNTGSLIQHMFTSQLAAFEFGLPPLPEQHQIVAEVEARTTAIDHLEAELDRQITRSSRLRQSTLASAFSAGF